MCMLAQHGCKLLSFAGVHGSVLLELKSSTCFLRVAGAARSRVLGDQHALCNNYPAGLLALLMMQSCWAIKLVQVVHRNSNAAMHGVDWNQCGYVAMRH